MEISETSNSEDRVASLEKKVRDMEPLIKGLIAELLDLKSVAMTMSREADEYSRREPERRAVRETRFQETEENPAPQAATSSFGSTIIRPKAAPPIENPATPAEPEMVMIMQPDGTMKMEPRRGDSHQTNSSGGYGMNQKTRVTGAKRPL